MAPVRVAVSTISFADRERAGLVAELADVAHGGSVDVGQVAALGLREALLADPAEGGVDGLVAVAIGRADRGDRARPRLEDGHPLDASIFSEDLGHADLASDQRRHQTSWIWMSTPAGR